MNCGWLNFFIIASAPHQEEDVDVVIDDEGDVEDDEMFRVFNMGIGLTLVASEYYAESIQQQLISQGFESWRIGRIVEGRGEGRWA